MERPALIALDVNETLLSLDPVREALSEEFGHESPPVGEWFARMLLGSLLANHLDQYRSFGSIGADALVMVSARHGAAISPTRAAEIIGRMKDLPPHPDVVPAIGRIHRAGIPLIALTNGSSDVAGSQIANSGLGPFVTRVISVDEVGRFKPDESVYRHAAAEMGVALAEMMLVAAHDWDCAGAVRAGAQAAYVQRPGARWTLPSEPPEVQVTDLAELADLLGAD